MTQSTLAEIDRKSKKHALIIFAGITLIFTVICIYCNLHDERVQVFRKNDGDDVSEYGLNEKDGQYYILHRKDNKIDRTDIPTSVTEDKDCKKFSNWQFENISLNTFPIFQCPWEHSTRKRIVMIGGKKFAIDRSFMYGSSSTGNEAFPYGVKFAFIYPSWEGGLSGNHDFVWGGIQDIELTLKEDKIDRTEWLHMEYKGLIGFDEDEEYKIIDRGYNKALKRRHFKFKHKNPPFLSKGRANREWSRGSNIYTNDNLLSADDFIVCDVRSRNTHAACHSAFFYDKLFVEFSIPRSDLEAFDIIKNKIISFLDEWSIE